MPHWVPQLLAAALWLLTAFLLLLRWVGYGKTARAGRLPAKAATGYMTADLISLGFGLGVAFVLHRALSLWVGTWKKVPAGTAMTLLFLVLGLGISILMSKLYQRYGDARVRAFLLTEPGKGREQKGNVQ